jgi:hypothetical protein
VGAMRQHHTVTWFCGSMIQRCRHFWTPRQEHPRRPVRLNTPVHGCGRRRSRGRRVQHASAVFPGSQPELSREFPFTLRQLFGRTNRPAASGPASAPICAIAAPRPEPCAPFKAVLGNLENSALAIASSTWRRRHTPSRRSCRSRAPSWLLTLPLETLLGETAGADRRWLLQCCRSAHHGAVVSPLFRL